MILATHAVVGAASAIVFRDNPAIALTVAFLSHFVLDAIPHWHYRLLSRIIDASLQFGEKLNFNGEFLKDTFRTGIDFGVGLVISLAISQSFYPDYFWLTAFGAFAGALPDLLQVIYERFPNTPLYHFKKFHENVHAKTSLDEQPLVGISQQIIVSIAAAFVMIYFS
ncbi:MAG: hypothetical protein HY432_02580 [Candidatus Liptonbacteria bacterium]|nr:hypothetical protein [Candidatus Liptonbacteria bacterium]